MIEDPTLTIENRPPVSGVHGKTRRNFFPARGTLLQNVPENDPVQNSTTPAPLPPAVAVPTALDIPSESKVLAKKILTGIEYKSEYAEQMVEFFMDREKSHTVTDTFSWKNGEVGEKEREVPNPPPMFSEFGREIGVSEKTIKKWTREFPEFKEAYDVCESIVKEFIVNNGLTGLYPGQFAIFAGKNLAGMKDVQHNRNLNANMKDVLDAIEKGVAIDTDI